MIKQNDIIRIKSAPKLLNRTTGGGKLTGCKITAEIAAKLAAGVRRHLIGTGNTKISIPEAYTRILYDEFRIEWVLGDRLPTLAQFRAFLKKNFAWAKPPLCRVSTAGNGKQCARK